ncbi:LOW QUALITY PROTEIN: hypothetical protein KUTeg_014820 [Tegillarca granosa]|uniref:RUN domain-containing protein n=1 Tax=Tegillarca granosa TaxID=220873 RepID=A0ABQ9EQW7_TEGGR|nr:LOW QUALITY PROTEIN: hypothetical protein KUTeg_014820 [Tegillarca granosa]
MDVSTSEREMMCSSDMLDFSDNPIFTPSPTREERSNPEITSTDSLDKCKGQNQSLELSTSQTSSTGHLCMDCCPRKDAYFLSFDGSGQGRSTSTSDIENSTNSFGSGQGQVRYHHCDISTGSGEEMEDECSDSFHFVSRMKPQHSVGKRFQPLGALHEKPLERSQNSDELRIDCLKKSLSPKKDPKNAKSSANKICLMCSPKKVEGHCKSVSNGNSPIKSKTWAKSKPKGKTSWKQIKSLRKLGKVPNGFDNSKSNSMPELCLCSWPSVSSQGHLDLQSVAESFHGKRHSAYLLELYQRIKNQSNPVSPEAMANIEQILFQPMIGQNRLHGDKGFLKLDEHCCELCKEDSHSSHTLTNSRVNPGAQNGGHHLESATRKRILDWLDKEKDSYITCDCYALVWNKNFGSQFPPASRDCAIQTSVQVNNAQANNTHDAIQQTTPLSERNEILAMLPKDFKELDDILPQTKPKAHNQSNSFYSHKSLPDLSFLSQKSSQPIEHDCSIFDPLPNPVPIPALVPSVENTRSRDSGRSSPRLQHHCHDESKPHCGSSHRSRSAPSRLINHALTRTFAESGSSSSGFSTSSTSSGIDPGYSEPRSLPSSSPYGYRENTSPCNDIERLLFYPPHVEISVKKDNCCKNEHEENRCFQIHQLQTAQRQHQGQLAKRSRLSDKKVNKYANEAFPNLSENKQKILASHKSSQENVNGSTSNSSLHLENLYSLQEEQTPVSSPEQHNSYHNNTYCYHDNTYCQVGTYGYCQYEQGSDWDQTQEVILHRKFDLDIGSHLSSESGSSSSSSLIPNFDRKPLKSCLRKKQFLRSRSMSDPFSLLQQFDQQREARKINRHSYACEEVYLLTDETGEYFLYQNDSETEEPVLFYRENSKDSDTQTVKRRQKHVENETSGDQSDKELTTTVEETDTTTISVESSDSDTPPTEFKVSLSPPEEAPVINGMDIPLPKRSSSDQSLTEQLDRKRDTPEVGELVLTKLCPLIGQVLSDGLKPYVTGVHMFGRVKVTVWKVAEASAELGPYTRAIHELVQQLKTNPGLVSCSNKFDAFIFGLLNLRLLDFWMGYLQHNESLTKKFYNTDGVILLGQSYLQTAFDQMLVSLQPLAILPFQLGIEFIVQRPSVKIPDRSPLSSPVSGQPKSLVSPTEPMKSLSSSPTAENKFIQDDKNANQMNKCLPPAKPPRLQQQNSVPMFSASKAWDWLKGSTNQDGPSSSVLPKTSDMMSSITEMFGKLTGKTSDSNIQNTPASKEKGNNSEEKKVNNVNIEPSVLSNEEIKTVSKTKTKDSKPVETAQNGSLGKTKNAPVSTVAETKSCKSENNIKVDESKDEIKTEMLPFIDSKKEIQKLDYDNTEKLDHVTSSDPDVDKKIKATGPNDKTKKIEECSKEIFNERQEKTEHYGNEKGDNSLSKTIDQENNVTDCCKAGVVSEKSNITNCSEKVMKRSLTDLAQNLFGRTPSTYKKGITEYNFNTEKEQNNGKQNGQEKGDCSKSKPDFTRSKSLVEGESSQEKAEIGRRPSFGDLSQNVNTAESTRKLSLEVPQLETKLSTKLPQGEGDVNTKGKSGIIKLFDKLLLPRQSLLKQPQQIGKSFSSGELKPQPIKSAVSAADSPQMRQKDSVKKTKYRWSWSLGQNKNKYPQELPEQGINKLDTPVKTVSSIGGQKGKDMSPQDAKKITNVKNITGTKLPVSQPKPKERRNSYIYTDYTKVNKKDENIDQNSHQETRSNSSKCVSLESGPVVKAPSSGSLEGKNVKNGGSKKTSKIGRLVTQQPKTELLKGDNPSVAKSSKSVSGKKLTSLSG